jgi:hypothetical protein
LADTKISALTDGASALGTDRLPVARSPYGAGNNAYLSVTYVKNFTLAGSNTTLGGADAASPTAQTLSVQNVATGTTDTAGADFTIAGSQGTGTGAGGNIVFQTAPAGGSGSSQNALATALTIRNDRYVMLHGRYLYGEGATNKGQIDFIATTVRPTVNSAPIASFCYPSSVPNMIFPGAGILAWTNLVADPADANSDTFLGRQAAANIRMGAADAASPVAQTFSAQSVVAGTSNTAGVDWTFKASAGTGTGAGGKFIFQTAKLAGSGTSQNTFATTLTLDSNNNVVCHNAATATNANDGFLYIPTCAGTPTGTPTTYTGRVALIYDTTNNKMYVYNTAWKGGTAPGAWS